jgi:hypothetical protein
MNAVLIDAGLRKEWKAASIRCVEKYSKIAQRRAAGIDNYQESQAGRSRRADHA